MSHIRYGHNPNCNLNQIMSDTLTCFLSKNYIFSLIQTSLSGSLSWVISIVCKHFDICVLILLWEGIWVSTLILPFALACILTTVLNNTLATHIHMCPKFQLITDATMAYIYAFRQLGFYISILIIKRNTICTTKISQRTLDKKRQTSLAQLYVTCSESFRAINHKSHIKAPFNSREYSFPVPFWRLWLCLAPGLLTSLFYAVNKVLTFK